MNIRKRSGELVNYDRNRVVNAVFAAMKNIGQPNRQIAIEIADEATSIYQDHSLTSVEELQDVVEELLMQTVPQVAKEYILHRDKRSKERNKKRMTPHVLTPQKLLTEKFLKPYFKNPNPFPTQLGEFVYYRTYARAIAAEQRRETWAETVERVVEFSATLELNAMQQKGIQVTPAYLAELRATAEKMYDLMYNFKLFPSGRSLFVGGTESSFASSISNFNCSFLAVDEIEKFSELFLVLMLGKTVPLTVAI